MKKVLLSAAAAVGLAVSAGVAHASPVTIVFQNPGADTPVSGNFQSTGTCNGINVSGPDLCTVDNALGFDYAKGFANLNVTAIITTDNSFTALLQDLAPTNSGLAALTVGEGSSDDQVQVSSNEALVFDFGTEVHVHRIDFNAGADRNCDNPGSEGPCGEFELIIDGNTLGTMVAEDNKNFGTLMGQVFEIRATDPLDGGFTIGSITVSETPLPAGGVLLLSGLGGLGFARRRKAQA